MKWSEYKNDNSDYSPAYVKTDIECPECGLPIYEDVTVEYLSNPPQHDFYCFGCGWKGRA